VCVRKVYCGKTADLIELSFGLLSGVSPGIGILDGSRHAARGREGGFERFP